MRVLVTGSELPLEGDARAPQFREACRALGEALARAGHSFVVGSDREGTADPYVLAGADQVDGVHEVQVFRPESGSTPFEGVSFKHLKLTYAGRHGESWTVARVAQILVSDAVILIGGTEGTYQVGHTAPMLERPVLAIPSFGGSARRIWDARQGDYARIPSVRPLLGILREQWQTETATTAVRAVEELRRHNPYRSAAGALMAVFALSVLALLVAWIWFLLHPPFEHAASLFGLLLISALAGVALRTTLLVTKEQQALQSQRLIGEGVVAALLAFGLTLAYMAGGLTVTGSSTFLEMDTVEDYERVGIVMSILGFGAGFLTDRASERLTSFFGRVFAE